jgi:hypothetical protein
MEVLNTQLEQNIISKAIPEYEDHGGRGTEIKPQVFWALAQD